MKPKKNKKANLERSRIIFLEIGLILSLSLCLMAFEYGTKIKSSDTDHFTSYFKEAENDIIITTRNNENTVKKTKVADIINIVDDKNLVIDVPDLSYTEIEANESFDIWNFESDYEEIIEDTTEFLIVEEMPLFNGGKPEIEFSKYIAQNLKYPQNAIDNGVTGRVILSFVVNKQGKIENISIYNSAHPDLDRAAMKAVINSPRWTPGKQRGKAVNVRYFFPAFFKLN